MGDEPGILAANHARPPSCFHLGQDFKGHDLTCLRHYRQTRQIVDPLSQVALIADADRVFGLRKRKPAQYRLLQEAALQGQREQTSLAKVKFLLAGLLLRYSDDWDRMGKGEALHEILLRVAPPTALPHVQRWIKAQRKAAERVVTGCRLTTPDIKQLFDAVAHDRGIAEGDRDFLGKPNTIYRRIERNAKAWRSLRDLDIRRAA